MYHQYVLKDENQNPTTTWIQEAANFLIQTGQTFGDVGRTHQKKTRVDTKDKNWTNNAFVKIYECTTSYKPSINRNEIEEISLYPLGLVKEMFENNPTFFVPGFKETFEAYLHAKEQKEASDNQLWGPKQEE